MTFDLLQGQIWGTELLQSTFVIQGICGGGDFQEKGGATEYICLPHDPEFIPDSELTMLQGYAGHMYGGRVRVFIYYSENDDKVPCSVCHVSAATTIMIPAKTTCPSGWSVQYHGFLISGHYDHAAASQFICLNQHPEYFEGRRSNLNGKLIYGVRTVCGSLPCPPYENNRLLPCVVCSQ